MLEGGYFSGIAVTDTQQTVIGADVGASTHPADVNRALGNVIVGSSGAGVSITGVGSTGTTLAGNFIGVDRAGTATNLGNSGGVFVFQSSGNQLGPANTVAHNSVATGFQIEFGTGNRILGNSIHSNGGLGIELTDGANNNRAAPNLASATFSDGATTIVQGTFDVMPAARQYMIEVFSNTACDPSGFGEGETFVAGSDSSGLEDGAAEFSFDSARLSGSATS